MEISWGVIEQNLGSLAGVSGGFSAARRGIVELPNGQRVFVKTAEDKQTQAWTRKEIAVYHFLQRQNFMLIPKLLSWNDAKTGFALEALLPTDGWNWQDEWSTERLDATIAAMNQLAKIPVTDTTDKELLGIDGLSQDDNGWFVLRDAPEYRQVLMSKLRDAGWDDLAQSLDIAREAVHSSTFAFANDTFVHHDVRADNCAWNKDMQTVRLVDWTWTQLGDRRIDLAATLVNAHKNGLDVTKRYHNHLDASALHWMAGFWFKSAATPIWPGGPALLRDFQLQSGITALELARSV